MACALTYWDAVEHLRHYLGGNAAASAQRDLKRAVHSGLRVLSQARQWTYLFEQYQLNLYGAYTTGTITFDYTGGAYERLITFSTALDSTTQTWAHRARIWIDNVAYRVDRYIDSTRVTLNSVLTPTADVAAGTEFTLVQSAYPLPGDFVKLDTALPANSWLRTMYVTPDEWLTRERFGLSTGSPARFTIMGDSKYVGTMAMHFDPAPDSSQTMTFTYQRRPRSLHYSGHAEIEFQGTVTVDGSPTSSTTVTGNDTAFESEMVGSVMRISKNAKRPTDVLGDNPAKVETVIKTYSSATSLVVEDAISADYGAVGYIITDLIDIDQSLHEAFFRAIEWQLELIRRGKNIADAKALYDEALQAAAIADNRVMQPRYAGDGHTRGRRLADFAYTGDSE